MMLVTKLVMVLLAMLVLVSGTEAATLHMGTYTYLAGVPNGDGGCLGDAGVGLNQPVAFTASSALGDGLVEATSVAFGLGGSDFSYVVIGFNFGGTYQIDSVDVTSFFQNEWWGMGPLAWAYTLDGSTWSTAGTMEGDWRYPANTQTYPEGGGFRTRSFDVNMAVQGIALYIEDDTNWYGNLAEVQFNGVPEPATMFLLALGGLGMLRRHK